MGHSPLRQKESQKRIVSAIESAELNTSGEIRVHVESSCKNDPIDRAVYIFNKLKMYNTEQRNAVLIYVAYSSHKLSIIGDSGINEKVSDDFWGEIKNKMTFDFSEDRPVDAVCTAVLSVGESLKKYFPYLSDDVNEQPNEVSFGD